MIIGFLLIPPETLEENLTAKRAETLATLGSIIVIRGAQKTTKASSLCGWRPPPAPVTLTRAVTLA